MELLRSRGAAAAEKKAGRETGEGRIGCYNDKDKGIAALVEVRCETAPTSNNPEFIEMVNKVAKHAALAGAANVETIESESFVDDGGITVKDVVQDVLNKIRENMRIHRVVRVEGRSGTYVHHNGRVGVIVTVEGDGGDDALLTDFCMHAAAMSPATTTRDEMPADVVEKEKEIARQQILDSGKPENLVDKILIGKMNKWFSEQVFVEQAFVKDDKQTVKKVADAAGVTIKSFVRMAVGES
jgi:elongation factor Ts